MSQVATRMEQPVAETRSRSAKIERFPVEPTRALTKEMDAASSLLADLRTLAGDDQDFLADLIEGQTNVLEIIAKIDASELDDQTDIAGLEVTIKTLQSRKAKAEKRSEMKRAMMASALDKIGLRTHRTPLGTITVSDKTPVAVVLEEAYVPARFWKAQAPKLDKDALNKAVRERHAAIDEAARVEDPNDRSVALKAAHAAHPEIPGATLSNGGVKISIRR